MSRVTRLYMNQVEQVSVATPAPIGSWRFSKAANQWIEFSSFGNMTGAETYAFWLKQDSLGDAFSGCIIGFEGTLWQTEYINYGSTFAEGYMAYCRTSSDIFGSNMLVRIQDANLIVGSWALYIFDNSDWKNSLTAHTFVNNVDRTFRIGSSSGADPKDDTSMSFLIGAHKSGTKSTDMNIAQVAAWNRVLNASERASLASGKAPSFIQSGLLFYFPGNTNSTLAVPGGSGANHGATFDSGDGPTIIYP